MKKFDKRIGKVNLLKLLETLKANNDNDNELNEAMWFIFKGQYSAKPVNALHEYVSNRLNELSWEEHGKDESEENARKRETLFLLYRLSD